MRGIFAFPPGGAPKPRRLLLLIFKCLAAMERRHFNRELSSAGSIKVTDPLAKGPSGAFGGDNNMNSENLQGRLGLGSQE